MLLKDRESHSRASKTTHKNWILYDEHANPLMLNNVSFSKTVEEVTM